MRYSDVSAISVNFSQSKWQSPLVDITQSLAEEPLMLFRSHSESRLRYEVAERFRGTELSFLSLKDLLHFRV
jgi:hypothetical protein